MEIGFLIWFMSFAFVFGGVMASFFGSLSYRLETNKKFLLKKRSFCPKCEHDLNYRDLVPILSFLFTKGRCRYCSVRIDRSYFVSELSVGLLWVIFAWGIWTRLEFFEISNLILLVFLLLIMSFLMVIDIFYYILPHQLNALGLFVLLVITGFDLSASRLLGMLVAVGFFVILWLITKFKGIGLGDVGLAFWMGYGLGAPVVILGLMLSFIFGAVFGVGLMSVNKKGLKQAVPFGPFLIFGFVIAWFWGKEILSWYVARL